ncbi:Transcription initiation factor [Drechslerella dactyloides]|uniref:Transcription initiation factor n=1 Tax=Drechslerella dactyloides TaxID=74499 RepID=A0AAD6ISN7_DREDA|nr:Transcription initiation factor [Drechslerella dactyloides]
MDTPEQFYFSLLRISTAQMLRHAGLAGSRPSVLDTLTDMTARYLTLLGTTARSITESSERTTSELTDALLAMEHLGLLKPLTIYTPDLNDTRAVDNFIAWAKSPEVEELRKLAGVVTVEVDEEAPEGDSSADTTTVPDVAASMTSQKDTTQSTAATAKRPVVPAAARSREPETDIPIKRENVDDQPALSMMMDIDGIPSLEDSMLAGTVGLNPNDSMTRGTEPPPDAGETTGESTKAKVRMKQVDWFTALKLKEDAARFDGTLLGKHVEKRKIVVEGGDSVPVQLPGQSLAAAEQQQPNGG